MTGQEAADERARLVEIEWYSRRVRGACGQAVTRPQPNPSKRSGKRVLRSTGQGVDSGWPGNDYESLPGQSVPDTPPVEEGNPGTMSTLEHSGVDGES